MSLAELGLIGNCQIAALVDRRGAVVWACLPRFDSPPLFGALLDAAAGGHFTIGAADGSEPAIDAMKMRAKYQRLLPGG